MGRSGNHFGRVARLVRQRVDLDQGPLAGGLVRFGTYADLGRNLVIRAFTPVGFVLAVVGLGFAGKLDRLWVGWGVGCLASFFLLAAKWHHGYYWMVVAPVAAVGVARGFVLLATRWHKCVGIAAALAFLGFCVGQGVSTFRTPPQWASLVDVAREISSVIPDDSRHYLIAPEALLYYADRQGMRLELNPEASRRAAAEWGGDLPDAGRPLALVQFYRERVWADSRWMDQAIYPGTISVADVGLVDDEPRRRAFREALRANPESRVLVDRPGFFFVQ